MKYRPSPKVRKALVGSAAVAVLGGMNAPAAIGFAQREYHQYEINRPEYKARYGHWDLLAMPTKYRVNSIHATLLPTGKVLLIAGSGNSVKHFNGGRFDSTLWDPATNTFKKIPTPKDLFCGGHTPLPDGRLLIAGGTARYEVLQGDVERAGGAMLVKSEDPDHSRTFPKGTLFRSPTGKVYASQLPVSVPRATKTVDSVTGRVTVTANQARVYVEAIQDGPAGITNTSEQYEIAGLRGRDADNFYGMANKLGMDKKDFQGIREAYEFDPFTEKYLPVRSMSEARWYPTLVSLADGKVLTVSGLDDIGQIIPGKNEIFDPETRTWSPGPLRYFPTYPSLFLMRGGRLFYSGSNAGYGPANQGRTPGIWDPKSNSFTPVRGLKDADTLETSSSLLLPPAQRQKAMVLGGGGVGESPKSTARTAIIDLTAAHPKYVSGPDLPAPTRYLNSVILPDDTVFTTGGSKGYRGRSASNLLQAQFYDPTRNAFIPAAAPTIGRNYHTEALLLPDGRVAVFGSDSLFADKANTTPGTFEQRVEIYTPPYLYRTHQPQLGSGPTELVRGVSGSFPVTDAAHITTARLIHPGSSTHVTDVDQRSVALDIQRGKNAVTVTVPREPSLVPSGWYMLFVTDNHHTPSKARWIHIS
ncbi:galactose oxidase-like domain-containing protein [Streptomyces sp. NPDC020096]